MVGADEGVAVGAALGRTLGAFVGTEEGGTVGLAEGKGVGTSVGVNDGNAEGAPVGAVEFLYGATEAGSVIALKDRVTAALRANKRPCTEAPLFTEIAVKARIFPITATFVARVAEEPTCQYT